GLGATSPEAVRVALADAHPEVRRHALRVGEWVLKGSPALGAAMVRLADDPEPRVRFQLALTLGGWDDPRAGRALAGLLRRDADDPWLRAAVLSSATPHAATILTSLFAEGRAEMLPEAAVVPLFGLAGALRGQAGLAAVVRAVATPEGPEGRHAPWQFSALAGLLDAADRARTSLDEWGRSDAELKQAIAGLSGLFGAARQRAADAHTPEDQRLAAVRLLGREPGQVDADRQRLTELLRPQVPSSVQGAAVAALGRARDPKVAEALLAGWRGYTPGLRGSVLDTLLSREAWTGALLSSLEDTCVPAAEIDPVHRRRLLDHADAALRRRAAAVFAEAGGPRSQVIERYRAALELPGHPEAGAVVFRKICASCHRLDGQGTEVGPDLATLTDKSPETLLTAILDPNRAFEAKYTNFTVATLDGRVLSGMIAGETAVGVTLRRQEGQQDDLLRDEIEAIAGSGQSLMPEGLEQDLSPQDLADLIAYLRGDRKR
ncbi:MAG TPA: HEAT repeat domain-containing protein, partial [Isosphaeraceae bacterium]